MFSYDPAQLDVNEVYAVRCEIQDTDPLDPQLQDEEVAYAISQERNYWCAAARCSEMIARKILRKADVRLGTAMMVTYTKMADQWFAMAKELRAKSLGTVAPYVGGMTIADKITIGQDSSLLAPLFTKTMMQNPYAGGYSTDSLPPEPSGNFVDPIEETD